MNIEINSPIKEALARRIVIETLGVRDVAAFDLASVLFQIRNLMERLGDCVLKEGHLSSARLLLLIKLVVAERMGHADDISPTMLSRYSNVSRNTISALLRGLEAQGLIMRALDPADRRRVHIRLTDAGRELVAAQAPRFTAHAEGLFAHLTKEEREMLLHLLEKVRNALVERCVELEDR